MDLFKEAIPFINSGEFQIIAKMSDEEIKQFAPYVILKFMSATKGKEELFSIIAVNEVVNKLFWELNDHPKLQLMLLSLCATKSKYKYFPGKLKNDKIFKQIQKFYPLWKTDEVNMYIHVSTKESFLDLAMSFGMQDKDLKEWKKEIKNFK